MTKAIVMSRVGGPEVLEIQDVDVGVPAAGQLRIRHTAIGINYHDIYVRSGQYPGVLALPGIPGIEACGVVEGVGAGVSGFKPGDRVAYMSPKYGAYSEVRLLDARMAIPVPDDVPDKVTASIIVKGTTTALLLFQVASVQAGDTILVHAAAGGMGRLLAKWANRLGVTVIGTVGSQEKVSIARDAGCAHVVDYSQDDFVRRVQDITNGSGVRIAYDSVGKPTIPGSMECLAKCGHLVSFGQSGGPAKPITLAQLSTKSLTISRPIVFHYVDDHASLQRLTGRVFDAIRKGIIGTEEPKQYALRDAAQAHRDLESRMVMNAPILVP